MTDGSYNTIGGVNWGDNSNEAVKASKLSVDICANMKAKGIVVYTVGFDLDHAPAKQRAIATLSQCASDASKFYRAEDWRRTRRRLPRDRPGHRQPATVEVTPTKARDPDRFTSTRSVPATRGAALVFPRTSCGAPRPILHADDGLRRSAVASAVRGVG